MITSLYVALLALLYVALSVHVVLGRGATGVGLGDNQEFMLMRRIRAHANFAEYAPLFLILLGFAEMQGLAAWAVHGFGVLFLAGRCLHAYSVLNRERYEGNKLVATPYFRMMGMMATFFSLVALSLFLLVQILSA